MTEFEKFMAIQTAAQTDCLVNILLSHNAACARHIGSRTRIEILAQCPSFVMLLEQTKEKPPSV